MFKKLSITFLSLLLLAFPTFAFAQNYAPGTSSNAPAVTTNTEQANPNSKPRNINSSINQEISQKRAQFKEELATLKDQRKANIIERVDTRLNDINKTRTTRMTARLDRMSLILDKISSKEAELKTQGKDTTTLLNDIALATTAISSAKQAVITQSQKDYVINITSDTTLRSDAKSTVLQFQEDIHAVFLQVEQAREADLKAFIEELQLEEETSQTPNATQTNPTTSATTP